MEPLVADLISRIPEFGSGEFTIEPLHGGITNRNFSIKNEEHHFVIRIPGANSSLLGIDRSVEYASAKAAFANGVGPEVITFFVETETLVSRFVEGKVLSEEDVRDPAVLKEIVQALRTFHESPGGGGKFDAFETVRRYFKLAQQARVEFPAEIDRALQILAKIETLRGVPNRLCPCHNDLLPGNFIRNGNKVWIIDWEYAGVGDPFFDLGNLAANNQFDQATEDLLLELYFDNVTPSHQNNLRLMRMASNMREAMWGFLQLGISKLDFDYRSYATRYLNLFTHSAASVS